MGPAAWSAGGSSIKMSSYQHPHEHRFVKIDHEQRQRELAEHPEHSIIPDAAVFRESESWVSVMIKSSIGIALVGLLFLSGA